MGRLDGAEGLSVPLARPPLMVYSFATVPINFEGLAEAFEDAFRIKMEDRGGEVADSSVD